MTSKVMVGLMMVSCSSAQTRADRAELVVEGVRMFCEEYPNGFPGAPPELQNVCGAIMVGDRIALLCKEPDMPKEFQALCEKLP